MADSQQQQSSQQQQQQQQPGQQQQQVSAGAPQQQQQAAQRQMSQASAGQSQQHGQQVAVQQPQAIQPQPQQNIQPQPQQQSIQPQQQAQQQNVQQQQQQTIQQLPQLQQIAPQQQQHLLPNLQTMTSVPLSMAMAGNPMNGNITATNLRPQLGQLPQVQVIHQAMHSPSFMPQFAYNQQQQQLMLQNMQAAMQANVMSMNPQQINMANMVAMQGRPNTNMFTPAAAAQTPTTPTTPNIMNISSSSATQVTSTAAVNTNAVKPVSNVSKQQSQQSQQQQPQQQQQNIQQQNQSQQQQQQQQIHALNQVQQAQATAMIGGKPIILGQAGSLLQGQIGVISAGQLQTTQAYATGQTFGQIQSKQGQQIGMATNTGQGQVQLNSSQSPIRFSQPQLMVSNAGSAQLISSQPVFTNQMLQAMASQLQHFPQQPIMSAQGQTPTIISGQGLYIRSTNPVQTQGLVTGVQTAMNTNFKNPSQQTIQTVAVPIQKQTTAAQTGKVLLPSVSKPATAKVPPTSMTGATKSGTQAMPKPKGRPKGTGKSSPAVTSTVTSQSKTDATHSSTSKPPAPLTSLPVLGSPDTKSQSDSEVERKSVADDTAVDVSDHSAGSEKIEAKQLEMEMNEAPVVELETKPASVPDHPVEKQRAIVKPHILTHVIEGFVIQEGPEPFPVQRSSLLTEFIPPKPGQPVEQSSLISMDDEDMEDEGETSHEEQGPLTGQKSLRCEFCNSIYNSANSAQRFCSKSCAKRYNVGCTKRLHHFPGRPKDKGRVLKRKRKGKKGWQSNRLQSASSMGGADVDMEDQSSSLSQEDTPSPSTSPDHNLQTPPPELQMEGEYIQPLTSPSKWNVMDVYEFIKNLPGCQMYAEEFRSQEIDGQALLLLKEDHLMTTMNMKLGPALKICARINAIKEETG